MPKSKSKPTARVAFSGGLPAHPAMRDRDVLLSYRLGAEEPLRLPDVENSPSAATVLKSEYTLGSDAAGQVVWAEIYNLASSKHVWALTAGSTTTATTTAHPQLTAIVTEARVARMVAMKVTVTYIGTEQLASGYLSYFETASVADVDASTIDSLHTGSSIQLQAQEGLEVFVDYTQPPRYEGPNSSGFMSTTFPLAVFVASGLPVSTASIFRVRVSRFMEYLPLGGALSEGEMTHEPHNPGAIVAHGALSGPATSIHRGSDKDFTKRVMSVANAAYHMAQPLLPYVVPKARAFLQTALKLGLPALLGI